MNNFRSNLFMHMMNQKSNSKVAKKSNKKKVYREKSHFVSVKKDFSANIFPTNPAFHLTKTPAESTNFS